MLHSLHSSSYKTISSLAFIKHECVILDWHSTEPYLPDTALRQLWQHFHLVFEVSERGRTEVYPAKVVFTV